MALVPAVAGGSPNYETGGMTFLQLVQRTQRECGISGSPLATVLSQSGEPLRLVDWVAQAWLDIASLHEDWEFLRQPIEFTCAKGKGSYTTVEILTTSFANYKRDSFRCYPVGQPEGEQELPFLPYQDYRALYLFGANRTLTRRPDVFTIAPNKNFILAPTPDASYVINGEGYARPTLMTKNDDMPCLPPQYHMIIVYKAMEYYGGYESAVEVFQRGVKHYSEMLGRLQVDQLPPITWGVPLA